ncbi:MAG: hypothetical protein KIC63_02435 [Clostridium sp.]|nr:hypothetical protein [Clostridium sp.]
MAGSSAHTISKANSKHENFVIRCFIICYILLGLFIDKVLRNFHSNHAAKPLQGHALRAANIPKRQPVKSFSRGMYGSALRSKRFQAVLFAAKQKRNSRASTEEPAFLPVMYSQASNHSRSVKRCGWMADRIRPSCAASTGAHRRSER